MYQPISFNVIVQALEWHGLPRPELRQLSFSDHLEDYVTAEYLATWDAREVTRDWQPAMAGKEYLYVPVLEAKLKECFMDDVTVLNVMYSPFKDVFTATLYCTVARSMENWAAWLDRTN